MQPNFEVSLDPPVTDIEHKPEKIKEEKDGGPSFCCGLYDTELAHKIARELLSGLATACVDNTTGDVFSAPSSVAVDVRKEMVEYLNQRSESFVAESVVLENENEAENSDHPRDIISAFIDEFTSSKRNLFSRVSGWLLSEKREEKVGDFQREMEMNSFWPMEMREPISQTLIKNVDLKNMYQCTMKYNSAEELAEHVFKCNFRAIACKNESCLAKIIAAHVEKHDSVCPYKIIPCEQLCSASIMRREMDKHCTTVCPMKLVNCPFFSAGCKATIPYCTIEQHCLVGLRSHLLCILQGIYKGASTEDLDKRLEQLKKMSSFCQLAEAQNVGSLTHAVKNLDAELEPLEISTENRDSKEASSADKAVKEVSTADKDNAARACENASNEEAIAPNKAREEVVGRREDQ